MAPAAQADPATTPAMTPAATPVATPAPAATPPGAGESLLLPVRGVRYGQLHDTFAEARGGGTRPHEALDIMAPRGTPVLAAVDGTVEKLFESVPGGLTIYEFDRERNRAYYYAHLDRYAGGLHEGQALRRGDVIGYVGSTGNAAEDAPHLHFAIFLLGPEKHWWQGTAIDPYPLLAPVAAHD
jgi:murein DD-endopeptidase MepM/ murein hydrolase activator NlpD